MFAIDEVHAARSLVREHGVMKAWCLLRAEAIHASIIGDDRGVADTLAVQQALQHLVGDEFGHDARVTAGHGQAGSLSSLGASHAPGRYATNGCAEPGNASAGQSSN